MKKPRKRLKNVIIELDEQQHMKIKLFAVKKNMSVRQVFLEAASMILEEYEYEESQEKNNG